jgi:hypothetical protein
LENKIITIFWSQNIEIKQLALEEGTFKEKDTIYCAKSRFTKNQEN